MQAQTLCAHCGQTVPPDMKFCGKCGHPVAQEVSAPKVQSCPSCGAALADLSAAFCGKCGASLTSKAHVQPNEAAQPTQCIPPRLPAGSPEGRTLALSPALFVAVSGFVLATAATFLPWVAAVIRGEPYNPSLWSDDIKMAIAIVVSSAIGLIALVGLIAREQLRKMSWTKYVPSTLGIIATITGVLAYLDIETGTWDAAGTVVVSKSVGIGAYLVIAGGTAAAIGSFLGLCRRGGD